MEREGKKTPLSEKMERPELIRSACVEFKGVYYEAATHGHAWREVYNQYPDAIHDRTSPGRDGFMTTRRRFVDRVEAKEIAKAAGQLTVSGMNSSIPQLLSEDVRFDMAN